MKREICTLVFIASIKTALYTCAKTPGILTISHENLSILYTLLPTFYKKNTPLHSPSISTTSPQNTKYIYIPPPVIEKFQTQLSIYTRKNTRFKANFHRHLCKTIVLYPHQGFP
jgi:hypothetical protein